MEFAFEPGWLAVLFWCALAFWLAELVLVRRAGSRPRAATRQPPRGASRFLVLFGVLASSLAASGVLHHFRLTAMPDAWHVPVRGISLGLLLAGVVLRIASIRALGASFRYEIVVDPSQPLVSHGPYRRLRHPLYAGLLLCALGLHGLLVNSLGLVVGGVASTLVILWRMREEERAMEHALGERYRLWKLARARLLPGVY